MSVQEGAWRSTRTTCRTPMFDFDLNVVPPCENQDQEPITNHNRSQGRQTGQVEATGAAPIDLEAFDDDVIISSARAFTAAKSHPRKKRRRTTVVDLESGEWSTRNKRRRDPGEQTIINCDLYINVEDNGNSTRNSGQSATVSLPPPLPPKEPTFSCPVCMGPFVEEVSTKCGHVFCKACIKTAIAKQSRCPTCRKNITMKDIIRIYLPTTTSS